MKKQIDPIDALPSKRLYLSIIADYDITKGLCELIDNAIDIWSKKEFKGSLEVDIDMNLEQQIITISDNAGGVAEPDLRYLVAPGETQNEPDGHTIGIFGVGTKRATVAIAQKIVVSTRHGTGKTFQLEIDDAWLASDNWEIDEVYEVDNIKEATTIIELSKLRRPVDDNFIINLKEHLGAAYCRFLDKGKFHLKLDGEDIEGISFENWAFPPNYEPRRYKGQIKTDEGGIIEVRAIAGLCQESSPIKGEYGVYFYCNERLVGKALKDFDVGFAVGLAGRAHPNVSTVRVLISLTGEAQDMPWNSSKSEISYKHRVFEALRGWLVKVVSDYASLSRRWGGRWEEMIFQYKEGSFVDIEIEDFPETKRSFIPPLPRTKRKYKQRVKDLNKDLVEEKPWTRGLYEGMVVTDFVEKQKFSEGNRLQLILLDSTLEIAFKEYLVNEVEDDYYNDDKLKKIFQQRHLVHKEIQEHDVDIDPKIWKKIKYYYDKRCKLIHERSTLAISDDDINLFRGIVELVLSELFSLRFDEEN